MRIRNATSTDIPALAAVELSAAQAFRQTSVGFVEGGTLDPTLLLKLAIAKTLWVVADANDRPVGFVACYPLDGFLYVEEISVAAEYQKRGLGRRLMMRVEDYAREQGFPYIGLVTFRDIKWNGPFYKSLGYREITPDAFSGLHRKFDASAGTGRDPSLRCAMIKIVED